MANSRTTPRETSDILEQVRKEEPIINFEVTPPVKEAPANVVLRLSESNRRGRVNIDGEDFVFDPSTNKQRKVRLIRGVNTIWQDEQDGVLKLEKDVVNRNKRSLEFEDMVCILKPHDITAIQFAEVCNSNESNPNKFGVKPIYFNIWNPMKDAEREEAAELEMLEAIQRASIMPVEKINRHAVFLGIPLYDEMGNKASEKAIRTLYMRKAKNATKLFMDSVESPQVEILWQIKILVSNGTIDLGKQTNMAYWNNGGFIAAIPTGEDATKYLVSYALVDGEDNRNFRKQIQALAK